MDNNHNSHNNDVQHLNVEDLISQALEHTEISESTHTALQQIRSIIIEQKAYNRFRLDQATMYADVARDSYLTGQLALLDLVLSQIHVNSNL